MLEQSETSKTVSDEAQPPVYIVFNPVAGTTEPDEVRRVLAEQFAARGLSYDLYETTGADEEDVARLVRQALGRGTTTVVAAGGDGTVSAVACGLVGSKANLAILPIGTANVLARELGVPADLEEAVNLLLDAPVARPLDAMKVGEKVFLLHIAIGLTSLMHRDTSREAKRRFGRLAYLLTALRWALDFQPARFSLVVDGSRYRRYASMVVVANGATLGTQPFRWAEHGDPSDNTVEVCVLRASALRDYLALAWSTLTRRHSRNPRIKVYPSRQTVSIKSRPVLPVQGDGEIIGNTPVQIEVLPAAVCVIVPEEPDKKDAE